jgi:hypothetical protein
MLPQPSSSWLHLIVVAAAVGGLAGCVRPSTEPVAIASGPGSVGYVRMDELVKHHPLYGQLAQYNDSIAALNLAATVPRIAKPDAAIAKQEAALEKELNEAADRTKKVLDEKSKQYQARESQAIAQAMRASGSATSSGAIAQQMNATVQAQSAGVNAQAQKDLERYRRTLEAQTDAEIAAAQRTLTDRAGRTYRAKQDELSAKESALTLELASKDASERLSLRTRLSSLALEDSERDEVRTKLSAIDRREADALAPVKNRDQQTLASLQGQLHEQVRRELGARATEIRGASMAKYRAREVDVRRQYTPAIAMAVDSSGRPAQQINPNLPPQVRARIEALHTDYQKQFNEDAKSTIVDFNKTRDDLRKRYDSLRGVDTDAQNGAQAQIASLSKKRDDLYDQMIAQIGREVRLIAQQRGIAVVVTDPVANAGGVDLTADAMKDIESLHE